MKPPKCGDWVYYTKSNLEVQQCMVVDVKGNGMIDCNCFQNDRNHHRKGIKFTTAKAGTLAAKGKWSWDG